jgi:hypothetical protein
VELDCPWSVGDGFDNTFEVLIDLGHRELASKLASQQPPAA